MPYNNTVKVRRRNYMEFDVDLYETKDKKRPVEEFILSLDNKMQAKVFGMILLLEEKGTALREPYSKPLDDGIFELRIKQSSNITRVLYFFYIGGKIILTNGFVKKTQKTPPSEIEKAKQYRKDYLERQVR